MAFISFYYDYYFQDSLKSVGIQGIENFKEVYLLLYYNEIVMKRRKLCTYDKYIKMGDIAT